MPGGKFSVRVRVRVRILSGNTHLLRTYTRPFERKWLYPKLRDQHVKKKCRELPISLFATNSIRFLRRQTQTKVARPSRPLLILACFWRGAANQPGRGRGQKKATHISPERAIKISKALSIFLIVLCSPSCPVPLLRFGLTPPTRRSSRREGPLHCFRGVSGRGDGRLERARSRRLEGRAIRGD